MSTKLYNIVELVKTTMGSKRISSYLLQAIKEYAEEYAREKLDAFIEDHFPKLNDKIISEDEVDKLETLKHWELMRSLGYDVYYKTLLENKRFIEYLKDIDTFADVESCNTETKGKKCTSSEVNEKDVRGEYTNCDNTGSLKNTTTVLWKGKTWEVKEREVSIHKSSSGDLEIVTYLGLVSPTNLGLTVTKRWVDEREVKHV